MQPFIIDKRNKFRYVRLVDAKEGYHQSIEVDRAREMAENANLDLVCFSMPDKNELPLCKVIDYGKWKYQQTKSLKKDHNEHKHLLKEVRFSPVIGEHDVGHKVKQVIEFLNEGDEVLLTMRFKGIHKRLFVQGEEIMKEIIAMCSEYGEELNRKKTGNQLAVRLKCKSKVKEAEKKS